MRNRRGYIDPMPAIYAANTFTSKDGVGKLADVTWRDSDDLYDAIIGYVPKEYLKRFDDYYKSIYSKKTGYYSDEK